MNKYKYIGHTLQLYGVEEYTLHGGKGNQTHIFHVMVQDSNYSSTLTAVLTSHVWLTME